MERFLAAPGGRILDVGCGRGELAARLQRAGHAVTAIDLDAAAVAAAWVRGVDARVGDFLTCSDGPFDLLLFSFSLHHIQPLAAALARAPALLAPGGRIICEEFAFESMDRATAAWFFATQELLLAGGLLLDWEPSGETAELEPLQRWDAEFGHGRGSHGDPGHAHGAPSPTRAHHRGGPAATHGQPPEGVHTAADMRAQLAAHFTLTHEEAGAGLYGFWLENLPSDRPQVAQRLLALERTLIAEGAIRTFGIRWVAEPR